MRAALVGIFLFLAGTLAAVAQRDADLAYIVRYQRVYATDGLCILVREDGAFHLEKDSARRTTPYEGTLTPEELEALKRITADPGLRDLRQSGITSEMIVNDVQAIQLAVYEPEGWHELTFPTPGAIRSHKNSLDPLVNWAQSIAKSKLTRLAESGVTRCMPGRAAATDPTKSPAVSAAMPATTPSAGMPANDSARLYVLRFNRDHAYGETVERQCVVLYRDGRYHLEDRDQEYQGKPRTRVYEGTVTPAALQQAVALVDDPALRSAKTPDPPAEWMREGEILRIAIPRADETQNLTYVRYFGVPSFGSRANEAGARSGMRYVVNEAKALDPLQSWIKDNIYKKKEKPLSGNEGNNCVPTPTGR